MKKHSDNCLLNATTQTAQLKLLQARNAILRAYVWKDVNANCATTIAALVMMNVFVSKQTEATTISIFEREWPEQVLLAKKSRLIDATIS